MKTLDLREVCDDPDMRQRVEWDSGMSMDTMLAALDGLEDQEDRLGYLDALENGDRRDAEAASCLLGELDPEFVFHMYGEEVLVWAAINASSLGVKNRSRVALEELANYDGELFEQSRLWCAKTVSPPKGREVLTQYAIASSIHSEGLTRLDLPGLLQDSARPGVELSRKRIGDYSLVPLCANRRSADVNGYERTWSGHTLDNLSYAVWMDAPVGFALTYKGLPQALAAVALSKHEEAEMMIYQLQGIRAEIIDPNPEIPYAGDAVIGTKSARGLAPLDWRRFLVDAARNLAQDLGISSIGIQEGKQNKWTEKMDGEDEPHLSRAAARKAYDETAERLGFERGEDGNWHQPTANRLQSNPVSA